MTETPPDFLNPETDSTPATTGAITLDHRLASVYAIVDTIETSNGIYIGLNATLWLGKENFGFISDSFRAVGGIQNPNSYVWYIKPEKQAELANRLGTLLDEFADIGKVTQEIIAKGKSKEEVMTSI